MKFLAPEKAKRLGVFSLSHIHSQSIVSQYNGAHNRISPVIPWFQPPDIQKRIQELRGYLDPNNPTYQPEQQHTNIKAAIKLYEDGKIDGAEQVFIRMERLSLERRYLEEVLGPGLREDFIGLPKRMHQKCLVSRYCTR
jgi:hypothetical protein